MADRPQCPYCPKRPADENALWQHLKAKHPGEKRAHLRPEREPSYADLMVDAELRRAAGEPNPQWLEDMLP